jgi:hypothetical protein
MEPKDLDYGPPLDPVLIQINPVHITPFESLLFLFKFVFIYALTEIAMIIYVIIPFS